MNDWIKDYILLSFKIDKYTRKFYNAPYVDCYLGDKESSEISNVDNDDSPQNLVKHAMKLSDSLPIQRFEPNRTEYLGKQVNAMEAMSRILCNENITYNKLIENCLDISPVNFSDDYFEKGLELFNQALPGSGSLDERYYLWLQRNDISHKKHNEILEVIVTILNELKNRSRRLLQLPEDKVDIEIVDGKSWGAANWYLGNYASLLQINKSNTISLFNLLPILCHEVYPGHHSEFSMREQFLLNEKLYHEHSIFVVNSPQLLISEGIAETAFEMLFTYEQAAEWMIENLYSKLDIKVDDVDLAKLFQALSMNSIDQISGNIVNMINSGYSEEDAVGYMMKYTLQPADKIRKIVKLNKDSLYWQIYNLSYANGKRLINSFIQNNKENAFRQIMKEQVYPSLITKKLNEAENTHCLHYMQ